MFWTTAAKKVIDSFSVLTSFQVIYSPWQNTGGSSTLWWLANVLNIHHNLFLNPNENGNHNLKKGQSVEELIKLWAENS